MRPLPRRVRCDLCVYAHEALQGEVAGEQKLLPALPTATATAAAVDAAAAAAFGSLLPHRVAHVLQRVALLRVGAGEVTRDQQVLHARRHITQPGLRSHCVSFGRRHDNNITIR